MLRVIGIILVSFLLKTVVFSPKPTEPGSLSHAEEVFGGKVTKEGEFFILDGDKYRWSDTESDYEWVE